jgi:hypothetical protein
MKMLRAKIAAVVANDLESAVTPTMRSAVVHDTATARCALRSCASTRRDNFHAIAASTSSCENCRQPLSARVGLITPAASSPRIWGAEILTRFKKPVVPNFVGFIAFAPSSNPESGSDYRLDLGATPEPF